MQLARGIAEVVGSHHTVNWLATLLTALIRRGEREEYAESSVMNAVCCEVETLANPRRDRMISVMSQVIVGISYFAKIRGLRRSSRSS